MENFELPEFELLQNNVFAQYVASIPTPCSPPCCDSSGLEVGNYISVQITQTGDDGTYNFLNNSVDNSSVYLGAGSVGS